ncbi:maltose/maltodextrin ABC transporter substrate-binding protein MalE [Ponticoccus sp. SC2-23]|uniref:maltose/maltodextrin ABC transporter substrate-binding protein MalE n=1 Tax=Alexandriicola marinus TaxID=2081710 RepID=UPI000FD7F5B3|nr:maltose/maltodextrin ABC transporter substrate-binding protein MalE [Alexandriicola marinus]MBM1220203.1 maltose/maltodextrin ABC transporter substrate-binding protein MalE [Ponticoccus sp. SC6-9]MBM1224889.1 maltose/maltodextrin ABC transporter substrate-binding protein MalE [Ponticoccus sp. SC6-15]MBM1228403.1 maltose/maltodextrin ABC transporter substrate-binding protein MalE [Ponticoccus sp. SC6-38]MBM1233960.1 maltose/maltodextrin ABC transporter substrate-binding protein MalE [Ponticoc
MKKTITIAALLLGTAMPAYAVEDGTLLIWTGANRDKAALEAAVQPFVDDYGIEVTVEVVDPDLPQKFQQAASTGDGPDIVMWAHDRFGEWASGGLIAQVQPSAAWADGVLGTTMDAVTFDGATWGYPVSVEAVHLIYNTDLIETPPASFEELLAMDFDGQKILWDYNNTYFTMPLLMANGGFAFEKVDGSYDGSATGVNNEGAIAGAAMLERLIEEGVMPAGVDYGVMDGAMNKGEVAMVLNGPWAWGGLKDSGINFAVAPIPSVDGAGSPPFLGVQAMAINAASPNADLAAELLENYLLVDDGLATWNANGALGALADASAASAQDDANISGMLEVAASGIPMPSNPEMGAFWAAMGPALTNITSGAQDPETALNDAAARILGEN